MQLVDTHCHIHEATFELAGDDATRTLWLKAGNPDPEDMIADAAKQGVHKMICVGCTAADSELAVAFVKNRPNCWASVGLHPHEAKNGDAALQRLNVLLTVKPAHNAMQTGSPSNKIVAIGECGLDYFYTHSPKKDQIKALRFQIELALEHNLPLIFHVREAYDDFWPILDSYKGVRGVLHSYTDNRDNLDKALARDLHIGLNGIMTFTKHNWQLEVAKSVPLQKLLLETDAPFLTPKPHRGRVNTPANVRLVAEFLAELRGETLKLLAETTTHNAIHLFKL